MHGGRLISFVLVAHALLTTAYICYQPSHTGATSHTLHKQALHHIIISFLCMEDVIGAGLWYSAVHNWSPGFARCQKFTPQPPVLHLAMALPY
jgi:hypothetical protein